MGLLLDHMDARTRELMLDEIRHDFDAGKLYFSTRLSDFGIKRYPELLLAAAASGDDGSLASALAEGCFLESYERRTPSGGVTMARMPVNAPQTLAEGEINRFYIRALCRRAIEDGDCVLEIYRAKEVANPRPESLAKIGATVNPVALLSDLRSHPGVDTALGLPAGPNSGLSVRIRLEA